MASNMLKILKYLLAIFMEYLKYPFALQNKKHNHFTLKRVFQVYPQNSKLKFKVLFI